MTPKELNERYTRPLGLLKYAVHELPAGVLYRADGANAMQCAEWRASSTDSKRSAEDLAVTKGPSSKTAVGILSTTRTTLDGDVTSQTTGSTSKIAAAR